MTLAITNSVASFSGQKNLTLTSNNLPKALERPTPDVKINDNSKGRNITSEQPAPNVKINFSAKGREAALGRPASDVKINDSGKERDANLERPAPDAKISNAVKGREIKLEQPAPDAKGNRRAEEPAGQIISQKQPTQIELQIAISDTKKAVKQVKAGEGALKEISNILLNVRDRVQDIAKNGTTDKDKQAINQKDIANALKAIDQIAKSVGLTNKKPSDKSAGKVNSTPIQDVKVLPLTVNQKTGTTEVKTAIAPKTEPTTSETPTERKAVQSVLSTNVRATKVTILTALRKATGNETPTDAANQDVADNTKATDQTSEVTETKAASKSPQVTGQASLQATNFGQIVLAKRGIVDSGGKSAQQPAVALTNLPTTLAAPAKSVEPQPAKTVKVSSTVNNEQPTEEGEKTEEDADSKKFSLLFQGGVTTDQIAKLILDRVHTDGAGAENPFSKLYTLNVSDQAGVQDSLKILEKVIQDTASLRSQLGALQTDTLESNANNLQANLAHQVTTESTIRDADFAKEIAALTKNQLRLQSGIKGLSNANQIPQLVTDLLKG